MNNKKISILGFSTDENSRHDFGPHTPGFVTVKYGCSESLEAAINENTAAVLIEPIQGEAGIVVPPENYLPEVRKICSKHNAKLY